MAIDWRMGANPTTASEMYAKEAAMIPDLGADFEEGLKFGQELEDREIKQREAAAAEQRAMMVEMRARENHEITLAQNKLALEKDMMELEDAKKELNLARQELVQKRQPTSEDVVIKANTDEANTDAAVITESPATETEYEPVYSTTGVELVSRDGTVNMSRKQIKEYGIAASNFRNNKEANLNIVSNFLNTEGIDVDRNSEKYKAALAIQSAKGYKRGNYDPTTGKFDIIIPVDGGDDIVIPGGDLATYFSGDAIKRNMSPTMVFDRTRERSSVLQSLENGDDVLVSDLTSVQTAFEEQFQNTEDRNAFLSKINNLPTNERTAAEPLVAAAQAEDSPGGADITAEEAATIMMGITQARYGDQIHNVLPGTETSTGDGTTVINGIQVDSKIANVVMGQQKYFNKAVTEGDLEFLIPSLRERYGDDVTVKEGPDGTLEISYGEVTTSNLASLVHDSPNKTLTLVGRDGVEYDITPEILEEWADVDKEGNLTLKTGYFSNNPLKQIIGQDAKTRTVDRRDPEQVYDLFQTYVSNTFKGTGEFDKIIGALPAFRSGLEIKEEDAPVVDFDSETLTLAGTVDDVKESGVYKTAGEAMQASSLLKQNIDGARRDNSFANAREFYEVTGYIPYDFIANKMHLKSTSERNKWLKEALAKYKKLQNKYGTLEKDEISEMDQVVNS